MILYWRVWSRDKKIGSPCSLKGAAGRVPIIYGTCSVRRRTRMLCAPEEADSTVFGVEQQEPERQMFSGP